MSTVTTGKRSIPQRKERRKQRREIVYTRFAVHFETRGARESGSDTSPQAGLLTDISTRGLGLISSYRLANDVEIVITLYPGTTKERQLVARAIWTRPLPTAGRVLKSNAGPDGKLEYWRVGLSLDQEDEEQTEFLKELIRTL